MDSGHDVTRLAFVLADLRVQLIGRLASDRVMLLPLKRPANPLARTSAGGLGRGRLGWRIGTRRARSGGPAGRR